jgi:hypothetical protein
MEAPVIIGLAEQGGIAMAPMFGHKEKKPRKTLKEKTNDLADKILFKAIQEDESIMRAYIQKRDGIDIHTKAEREISRLTEQTKLIVLRNVSDDIAHDPEVTEIFREKCIRDLMGLPPMEPKPRGKVHFRNGPNYHSQLEHLIRTIKYVDQLKELMGVSGNNWGEILRDPAIIKLGLQLIQGLTGSFGQTPQSNSSDDYKLFAVEIDGKWVEMDREAYLKYKSEQKRIELAKAGSEVPAQAVPLSGPVTSGNESTSLSPPHGTTEADQNQT